MMLQRVDPFIPVRRRTPLLKGQYGQQYFRRYDDAVRTRLNPRQHEVKSPNQPPVRTERFQDIMVSHLPLTRPVQSAHAERFRLGRRTQRSWWAKYKSPLELLTPVVAIAIMIALTLAQSSGLGELITALYGVFAVIRRVSSRITFLMALTALVCIVISIVLEGGENTFSDNVAVYVLLLLVIGIISLGIETRRE